MGGLLMGAIPDPTRTTPCLPSSPLDRHGSRHALPPTDEPESELTRFDQTVSGGEVLPSRDSDHAWHAVVSAVELRAALEPLSRRSEVDGSTRLAMGVSVHSGEVFVGIVGSPRQSKYAAVGDTVNSASRLEELNRRLGTSIVMSGETIALLKDRVEVRRRGWFPGPREDESDRGLRTSNPAALSIESSRRHPDGVEGVKKGTGMVYRNASERGHTSDLEAGNEALSLSRLASNTAKG